MVRSSLKARMAVAGWQVGQAEGTAKMDPTRAESAMQRYTPITARKAGAVAACSRGAGCGRRPDHLFWLRAVVAARVETKASSAAVQVSHERRVEGGS